MTITTTASITGKTITKYLGIVAGEAVIGSNLFDDLFRGISGVVSSKSSKYQKDLISARHLAIKDMQLNAEKLGANAIVGVDLDYEVLDRGEVILMVIANGTAVVVE